MRLGDLNKAKKKKEVTITQTFMRLRQYEYFVACFVPEALENCPNAE